jgi:hypothetical protein
MGAGAPASRLLDVAFDQWEAMASGRHKIHPQWHFRSSDQMELRGFEPLTP